MEGGRAGGGGGCTTQVSFVCQRCSQPLKLDTSFKILDRLTIQELTGTGNGGPGGGGGGGGGWNGNGNGTGTGSRPLTAPRPHSPAAHRRSCPARGCAGGGEQRPERGTGRGHREDREGGGGGAAGPR